MNPADQIEAVARMATAHVAAASRKLSGIQRDLADALAAHRAAHVGADDRLCARLQAQADAEDNLPGILLPADMAQGSPHLSRRNA
ncbi:hypothetical protein QSJ18_16340 [Gordonia sp. ABSL1-1]|uniref:hypothetical protein n=1 Tax=Gordonia sp. ABSL1-1 TaxID=3053923 RepID=UPI002573A2DC|nr:hypothetical protein [Gordonia sp. ABSL1-1]MDL9938322.1 hypothetical protein [Gordonia sp. ABSL1-1]